MTANWFDTLLRHVAERGRELIRHDQKTAGQARLEISDPAARVIDLCFELLSESGEAFGTALAEEVVEHIAGLGGEDRRRVFIDLANKFGPDRYDVSSSYQAWLENPCAENRGALMQSIEGRRQRLFRRINMAPRGTGALVAIRSHLLELVGQDPSLQEVENDLRHLLASWFNRGFLEFQRISWETPADVLEKLIAFESVHEVHGWNDLRRRLAPDRRCYAFFHPALPREPLIFVEVALQQGIATAVGPILQSPVTSIEYSDTAIFYSISNCQKGLKGINFGNFLIKQVVDELQSELPRLRRFSTLSPIPGFRKWLIEAEVSVLRAALGDSFNFLKAMSGTADICLVREFLIEAADEEVFDPLISGVLSKLCAYFLCELPKGPVDPVARFHLGNGARLERINAAADSSAKGRVQSFGLMANYLYEPEDIIANHQAFASSRKVARSDEIGALLASSSVPAKKPGSRRAGAGTSRVSAKVLVRG